MSVLERYHSLLATGTLQPDTAQSQAVNAFAKVEQALQNAPLRGGFFRRKRYEAVAGLYLWGGVGRGKSMLMDMFANEMAQGLQNGVRRLHFHTLMQEIHSALHDQRDQSPHDAILPVADQFSTDLRLLALDEMQITDITDAMIVGRLFERLFENGVTVVTTSNRPPRDLYKNGLNHEIFRPFIDLIEEKMAVHELVSDTDYRRVYLAGADRYFSTNDVHARAQIDRIWAELTHGQSEPLDIHVKGRVLRLERHANAVARMTFFELCGRPLGPADYLALAEHIRVLVLEDIPQLGRSNFNEAKRFVTLIDALYEAKVTLIASASARPDMLYVEGEGQFEFNRTASRLFEMQSENWGE